MDSIGIIINPNAKSVKKSKKDLAGLLRDTGGSYADVRVTKSFDDTENCIRDFKNNRVSCIGITGGDGTIHQVLTKMIRIYSPGPPPPILILRGGTMDNVARTISLKRKGPEILRRFIKKIRTGADPELHYRDTMKIGDRYCFLFGAGLTSNFLDAAYDTDNKGFLKNSEVILRALREGIRDDGTSSLFRRLNASVTVDGITLPFTEILGMLSGTVEHVGMGFSPLSRAIEKNGTFHLIISGLRPLEGVKQIFRMKKGKPLKGEKNYDGLATRLEIASPAPFRYTMDGDLYDCPGKLLVETGPPVALIYV